MHSRSVPSCTLRVYHVHVSFDTVNVRTLTHRAISPHGRCVYSTLHPGRACSLLQYVARGAARADDATWPDEHELNGAGAAEHPEWTMYDNATDSVAETTSVVSDAASHAPGTE